MFYVREKLTDFSFETCNNSAAMIDRIPIYVAKHRTNHSNLVRLYPSSIEKKKKRGGEMEDDILGREQLTLSMSKRKLPDPDPLDPEPLNPPRLERNLLFLFSSSSFSTSSRGVRGATASAPPSSSANCTLTSFFCDSAACCTSFALSSVSGFTSCRKQNTKLSIRRRATPGKMIGRSSSNSTSSQRLRCVQLAISFTRLAR